MTNYFYKYQKYKNKYYNLLKNVNQINEEIKLTTNRIIYQIKINNINKTIFILETDKSNVGFDEILDTILKTKFTNNIFEINITPNDILIKPKINEINNIDIYAYSTFLNDLYEKYTPNRQKEYFPSSHLTYHLKYKPILQLVDVKNKYNNYELEPRNINSFHVGDPYLENMKNKIKRIKFTSIYHYKLQLNLLYNYLTINLNTDIKWIINYIFTYIIPYNPTYNCDKECIYLTFNINKINNKLENYIIYSFNLDKDDEYNFKYLLLIIENFLNDITYYYRLIKENIYNEDYEKNYNLLIQTIKDYIYQNSIENIDIVNQILYKPIFNKDIKKTKKEYLQKNLIILRIIDILIKLNKYEIEKLIKELIIEIKERFNNFYDNITRELYYISGEIIKYYYQN